MYPSRTIAFFILCVFFISKGFSQKIKKIELLNANTLEFDKSMGKDAKRLIGNVSFKHENAYMYCDSAYLYSNNQLDAYGNVRITQGDTLNMYGDVLKYNGNEKLAVITGKIVRLVDKDMNLTTDKLTYNMGTSTAHYNTGAVIVNKENTLTSTYGHYHSPTKDLWFKKNVILTNPQYIMHCDTLRYNTEREIAYFLSPTTIKSKENYIYCENGWYDTRKDVSQFNKKAYLQTKEQKLKGDSLYYDRNRGYGKAIKNVEVIDTTQKIIVCGNHAEYWELEERSVVTNNAVFKQYNATDTLFMHSDTLLSQRKIKETPIAQEDSFTTVLYAYHHVKFFKEDLQGKCDSLTYSSGDSTMRLFKSPILWSERNQLTADNIQIKTSKGQISSMVLQPQAFIIAQEDSLRFNQIKGKKMTGTFKDNELHKIFVEGNGQTIYYARDGATWIGVNKAECSDLLIFLKESSVDRISFITKPEATLFPINDITPEELILRDFKWRITEKPKDKEAIFLW